MSESEPPARARTRNRWWGSVGVCLVLVLSAGCVGDRLPDLDRLGVTRSETGQVEIVFHPCNGEEVERILVRRSDENFKSNGEIVWEVESESGGSVTENVVLGNAPDGFVTSTALEEEIKPADPILLRVTTSESDVIPMSLRPEEAREGEILSRKEKYQSLAEFEEAAEDACA